MDHERTEKELHDIFEEIQHSYRTLVDSAFTLQEQTLELARMLFESSAEATPSTRARLEEIADESRSQREDFENLVRISREAYTRVLNAPSDEHHHKVEEARADLEEAGPS